MDEQRSDENRTSKGPVQERGSVIYVVMVSLVAALGGGLFGYDTAVVSGTIGFLEKWFELDANYVGWAVSCALVGCVIGVVLAGILSDRLGRKKVLLISAVLFTISAIGTALPKTFTQFVIFRIIGGAGVGIASMTSPLYIAEISPAHLRGRLVSLYQLAIIFGMLTVYFVNSQIAKVSGESWNITTSWRWMFGSETLPAMIFLVLLFFVPESPRWLISQCQHKEARSILCRVGGSTQAEKTMKEITETIAHESGSVLQLFQPGIRTAFVIGIVLAILQALTGIDVVLYYAPEIFKNAGFEASRAISVTVLVGVVNVAFTLVAIWLVDRIGRKPLLLIAAMGMAVSLFLLGSIFYFEQTQGLWVLILLLSYVAFFAVGLGPVVWVVISEIFPTRIRGRAMAIATLCLWITNTVVAQTFPMIDKNQWLLDKFHHGFSFWFYALMCVIAVVFVFYLVPETKGKSLEEIEKMWSAL